MNRLKNLYEFEDGYYHEVKSKDTLWEISRLYGVDVKVLMELNKITNVSVIGLDYVMVVRK